MCYICKSKWLPPVFLIAFGPAIADGCSTALAKVEQDWVLVRDPEGDFYVNPADPAKPDKKSAVGDGTPTFVFAAEKKGPIRLTLTTE